MNIKLVLPLLTILAVVNSEDIILGSNTSGRKIYDEKSQASPAIWRQTQNVTVNTTDSEVISRIVITDLRPDKDGDAKIIEGGEGQKSVTIELKSPTVLRGYDFQIQVYSVPDTQDIGGNNKPGSTEKEPKINPDVQPPKTIADDIKTPTPLTTDVKVGDAKRQVRSPVDDQSHDVIGKIKSQHTPNLPSVFGSDITTTDPLKATSTDGKATAKDQPTDKPFPDLLGVFNVERSTHIPAPQKDLKTNTDVDDEAVDTDKEEQPKTQDNQKNTGSPAIVGKAITPAPEKDLKTNPLTRHVRDTETADPLKPQYNKNSSPPSILGKAITPALEKDLKNNPSLTRQVRDSEKEDEIKTQGGQKNIGTPAIVEKAVTPAPEKDLKLNPHLTRQVRDTQKEDELKTQNIKNSDLPDIVSKTLATPQPEKDLKTSKDVKRQASGFEKHDQTKTQDDQKVSASPAIVGKSITPAPEKDLKTNLDLTRQARDTEKEDESKTQEIKKGAPPSIVGKSITPAPEKDVKTSTDLHRQVRDTEKEDQTKIQGIKNEGLPSIVGKSNQPITPAPEKDLKTNKDVKRQVGDTEKDDQLKTQDYQKKIGSPSIVGKTVTQAPEKDQKTNPDISRPARNTEDEIKTSDIVNKGPAVNPYIQGLLIAPVNESNNTPQYGTFEGKASTTEKSRIARDTESEGKNDEKESKIQNDGVKQVSPKSDDSNGPKSVVAPKIGFGDQTSDRTTPRPYVPPVSVHRRSTENAPVAKGPTILSPTQINPQKAKSDEDSLEDDITKANGQNEKKPVISIQ